MPTISKLKKVTDEEKRRLAEDAQALLDNPMIKRAILELRQRWFAELMENGGGDLTGARLCARIEALEAIPAELATIINDYRVVQKTA